MAENKISTEALLEKVPPAQLQALCDEQLEYWEIAERMGVKNDLILEALDRYPRMGRLKLQIKVQQ